MMTDNVNGVRYAIRHLANTGRQHIGFINGYSQAAVSIERLRGFETAMRGCGMPYSRDSILHADFTIEGGAKALAELLERCPETDAVFFASDLMAIGGIQHCKACGIRIPDDLAIIGFDNIELGKFVTPALTTVAQPRYAMGADAADMLVRMLQDDEQPSGILLPPELVVRESA
ncbi:hypothetical protein GCM10025858_29530 [Alicyclobacillus sacchari]|nr:hypothetical protein GCM10025858_29530 [Alicyclobacillus sacchari]